LNGKKTVEVDLQLWKSHADEKEGSQIINTGLNTWCLEWAFSNANDQHLAVGGFLDQNMTHSTKTGVLQIWRYSKKLWTLLVHVVHEFGNVLDLKWCKSATKSGTSIGLLACTFEDNSLRVLDIPDSKNTLFCTWS
jgi:hypothetical protein